jgi:DNA-binding GntR family transcriptional regulator
VSNAEHKTIRDAMIRKDGAAARRALQTDIEAAAAALKSILIEQKRMAEKPVRQQAR